MKTIALSGIRRMSMLETPDPAVRHPSDVLLQILSVGVCGSDVHYYSRGRIGDQIVHYPQTVGHECSARVVETGNAVTRVSVGDIIAVEPCISCHECDQCRQGRFHTCRNQRFLGCPGELPGCLSEYIMMPEKCCYKVPETMDADSAALIEPVSIGMHAVSLAGDLKGRNIGILGTGPIGLSVLLNVRLEHAGSVYTTDKRDFRCRIAKEHGAVWSGNPDTMDVVQRIAEMEPLLLDVIFECCGQQDALDQAVNLLKPGGKLIIVGIPEKNHVSFEMNKIRRKEITIMNVRRQNECIQPAIDLVSSGKLQPQFMITHHFQFDDARKAFDMVAEYRDNVIKAVIHVSK